MQSQQFLSILNSLALLTDQQKEMLINAVTEKDSPHDIERRIEENFAKAPKCPHCGSEDLHRWGFRNNRQRYRCKTCLLTVFLITGAQMSFVSMFMVV